MIFNTNTQTFKGDNDTLIEAVLVVDQNGNAVSSGSGLNIPSHDYILNTYDVNNNLENVKYYLGGAGGALQAEIALTYDVNNNLTIVERLS